MLVSIDIDLWQEFQMSLRPCRRRMDHHSLPRSRSSKPPLLGSRLNQWTWMARACEVCSTL